MENFIFCAVYFLSFSYFADLLITVKYKKNENVGHIVRGKHAITSLVLTKYLLSINQSFIKGSKKHISFFEFLYIYINDF